MGGLGLGPCFSASTGPARPLFPSLTFNLGFKAHLPMHDSLTCDELLWLAGNQSFSAQAGPKDADNKATAPFFRAHAAYSHYMVVLLSPFHT